MTRSNLFSKMQLIMNSGSGCHKRVEAKTWAKMIPRLLDMCVCVCVCVCIYIHTYNWITLLYSRNKHNILSQLYLKFFFKKMSIGRYTTNFTTGFGVKTWNRDSIIQYISIDPKDANEFQKYQCVNKIWVFRIKITKQFHSQAINYEDRGGEKRIHLSKLWKLCWTGNPFLPSFNHYNLNLMLEWFLQI